MCRIRVPIVPIRVGGIGIIAVTGKVPLLVIGHQIAVGTVKIWTKAEIPVFSVAARALANEV